MTLSYFVMVKSGQLSLMKKYLSFELMGSLSIPPNLTHSTYFSLLRSYDASQLHSSFEKTAFSCSICLENRKGKSCIQIPHCGCILSVFRFARMMSELTYSCAPCLSSCWVLAIEEGTLENVSCPSITCVKQRSTSSAEGEVDLELVQEVVGEELQSRWLSLKEKRKAEIGKSSVLSLLRRSSRIT